MVSVKKMHLTTMAGGFCAELTVEEQNAWTRFYHDSPEFRNYQRVLTARESGVASAGHKGVSVDLLEEIGRLDDQMRDCYREICNLAERWLAERRKGAIVLPNDPAAEIERLRARVKELEDAARWRRVGNEPPPEDELVLIWWDGPVNARRVGGEWHRFDGKKARISSTDQWRPMVPCP